MTVDKIDKKKSFTHRTERICLELLTGKKKMVLDFSALTNC